MYVYVWHSLHYCVFFAHTSICLTTCRASYIYMYIYIFIYIYTCIHIHIYIYIYKCIYIHVYVYIYAYVYVCIYIYDIHIFFSFLARTSVCLTTCRASRSSRRTCSHMASRINTRSSLSWWDNECWIHGYIYVECWIHGYIYVYTFWNLYACIIYYIYNVHTYIYVYIYSSRMATRINTRSSLSWWDDKWYTNVYIYLRLNIIYVYMYIYMHIYIYIYVYSSQVSRTKTPSSRSPWDKRICTYILYYIHAYTYLHICIYIYVARTWPLALTHNV